jgi:hypothetical protein
MKLQANKLEKKKKERKIRDKCFEDSKMVVMEGALEKIKKRRPLW